MFRMRNWIRIDLALLDPDPQFHKWQTGQSPCPSAAQIPAQQKLFSKYIFCLIDCSGYRTRSALIWLSWIRIRIAINGGQTGVLVLLHKYLYNKTFFQQIFFSL
jgi:hypothetical protein